MNETQIIKKKGKKKNKRKDHLGAKCLLDD